MFGILTAYGMRLPNDCRLQFSHHVSLREAALNPDVDRYIQREAQQRMAQQIAKTKMHRIEGDHSVEFRCELYVFNPDDFWAIVETAARDLNKSTQR